MVVRKHNLSGIAWYGHTKEETIKNIEWSFNNNIGVHSLPENSNSTPFLDELLGIVSPHAGYRCSGPHASHGYFELSKHKDIDSVIILGTNHTGMGSPTSLFPKGEWKTPLGTLIIDEELHDKFVKLAVEVESEIGFDVESNAHIDEHSIDNQLPFLQYTLKKNFKILSLSMGDHSFSTCIKVAEIISKILKSSSKKIIIVASSDFTHYLSVNEAEKKDKEVLNYLLKYDLENAVKSKKTTNASICGFGPVVTLFYLGKLMGMTNSKLLLYGHSGQTCSDSASVVAYASIIIGK